jgi:hypothetical protein
VAAVAGASAPWLGIAIACLVVLVTAVAADLPLPRLSASPVPLVGMALAAAGAASVLNNLPASVVLARFLGARPLGAYATLVGLSVGALATPQGSVATMIALDRADGSVVPSLRRYVRLWAPLAAVGTAVAVASLRLLA